MKRLILATASILALGAAGAGGALAAGSTAPGSTAPGSTSSMPAAPMNSASPQASAAPSKDQIELAQRQLRSQGLYPGPVDGVIGPQTEQALGEYQQKHGLTETARLDSDTMRSLIGGDGQGSSMPPSRPLTAPAPAAPGASGLGESGSISR